MEDQEKVNRGRSDEAQDPDREPGTGLGNREGTSANPDINPGGADEEPAEDAADAGTEDEAEE